MGGPLSDPSRRNDGTHARPKGEQRGHGKHPAAREEGLRAWLGHRSASRMRASAHQRSEASVTGSIQSTLFPSRDSVMAICVMAA